MKLQPNNARHTWSARTSFAIWTFLHSYWRLTGMTGSNDARAPLLNGNILVLFEVEPSGKIIKGDWFDVPESTACYLSLISLIIYSLDSGVPPLGVNSPSVALVRYPINGTFSRWMLAKKLQSPCVVANITITSHNDTWFETYVPHRHDSGFYVTA